VEKSFPELIRSGRRKAGASPLLSGLGSPLYLKRPSRDKWAQSRTSYIKLKQAFKAYFKPLLKREHSHYLPINKNKCFYQPQEIFSM